MNIKNLDDVMTAGEIAEEFHINRSTVRWACLHDKLPEGSYRKTTNGGNYLILRSAAEGKWGYRKA